MSTDMETDQKKLKREHSIQEYFYFGYIFLIILGISRQAIYFWFLDINILSYMTILDAILSPLVYLTAQPRVLIILIVIVFGMIFLLKFSRSFHHKKREKNWYKKLNNVEKIDKAYEKEASLDSLFFMISLLVISFFLGSGIGAGYKMNERMEAGTIKADHLLIFKDKSQIRADVLELNSQYVIYIKENAKKISITPISDNIFIIEKLKKDETPEDVDQKNEDIIETNIQNEDIEKEVSNDDSEDKKD